MQAAWRATSELNLARSALQALIGFQASEDIAGAEERWQAFLHHLDRAWNKLGNNFRHSPRWEGWISRAAGLRKRDPVLSYLMHARNVDEHVNESVTGFRVRPFTPGQPSPVAEVTIVDEHGQEHTEDQVLLYISKLILTPVVDRGREYPVPDRHLGIPLDNPSPELVGRLALDFYTQLVEDANAFFLKTGHS